MKKIGKRPMSLMIKSVLLLIFLIFPFNILALLTANRLMNSAVQTLEVSVKQTLQSQIELLESRIYNTNYLLYTLSTSNSDFLNMFQQGNDWRYTFYCQQAYKYLQNNLSVANASDQTFFYMAEKKNFINVSVNTENARRKVDNDQLNSFLSDDTFTNSQWHLQEYQDSFYLIRVTHDPLKQIYYGALIYLDSVTDTLSRTLPYEDMDIYFTDTPADEVRNKVTCSSAFEKSQLYLNASISQNELNGNIAFQERILLFVFLSYLLLIPALILLFRKHVNLPLKNLNQAHQELKHGNEDYRICSKAHSSEFQASYSSFNSMADTLTELRLENLNKELANKQLQLNYLQLQIRPHFLLNTLTLLYTLIQKRLVLPAQQLILYLSNYFRYMFRSENKLELFDKELSLIKEYLEIAAIQYPDSFSVSYQIDPLVSLIRVPPLLFHSFVENIIQHALSNEGKLHIVLYAEYADGTVIIQIADDGRGMSEDDIELINHPELLKSTNKHVGISNSISRLHYYYGDLAHVHVESELTKGTTFTITIPYNLEEE